MKNNMYITYKNCNFLHDIPIYFYFRFTKIIKIHFLLNISHAQIFS